MAFLFVDDLLDFVVIGVSSVVGPLLPVAVPVVVGGYVVYKVAEAVANRSQAGSPAPAVPSERVAHEQVGGATSRLARARNRSLSIDSLEALAGMREMALAGGQSLARGPAPPPPPAPAWPAAASRQEADAADKWTRYAAAQGRGASACEQPRRSRLSRTGKLIIGVPLTLIFVAMAYIVWRSMRMSYDFRPNAFPLLGLLGGRKRVAEKPAEPQTDLVDCSVFAPKAAPPGSTIMVQVFLHVPEHAGRAAAQATLMDVTATLKGVATLQTEIKRGARVDITLAASGLDIDEPQQSVVWRGEPVFAQFLITLPEACDGSAFHLVARIGVGGGLVGRIAFRITADAQASEPRSVESGDSARRYNYAFLSYASADRKEVLKRAQVLSAAGVGFFQDILTLDPGQRWEKEIYKHIDDCDLFLLFWSRAAKDSEWVLKEAEYALARAGAGEVPDIVPVIIEGPPLVPPPEPLKHLHFNDRISYLIAGS